MKNSNKWLSQEYNKNIGELVGVYEGQTIIKYESLNERSVITHEEIQRLIELGRIQYIEVKNGKLAVTIRKKVYNQVLGIYEIPER